MPNVGQHGYKAYPLVDHIADKVAAMLDTYGSGRPSTRYKDLVDLVAIVTEASVDAEAQARALHSEAERRNIKLPTRFDVPDRAMWEPGYRAEAERSLLPLARNLDEAQVIIETFLNPILNGTAQGKWEPMRRQWAV